MALSVRTMEALRAVADTGSFAAAARRMQLTQPGVAHLIRKVERDHNLRLFLRKAGGLVPTPFCDRLCEASDRALAEMVKIGTMLERQGRLDQGELAVGLGNAMPGISVIAAFNKTYPAVTMRVSTGSYNKIIREVIDHTVDVGILPEVPRDGRFRRKVLLTNSVVAIVHPHHPLALQERVSCADLLAHRLIFRTEGSSTQKVLNRYFHSHSVKPTPFLTLDTRDAVYEAVVEGMGVGFAWQTGTGRNEDVQQVRLAGASTKSEEVVFAPVDREMETIDAFFALVAQRSDGLAPGP